LSNQISITIFLKSTGGELPVKAIVDTAAQVTIISESIFNQLKHKPNKLKDVKLYTAGKDMPMAGYIVGRKD
jgi:hypothetical protein